MKKAYCFIFIMHKIIKVANIMMTSSNGNIFRVTGHLCGKFTGPRWIFRTKGQWRGALMFSLIYAWINDWVNNREAGDLRRQHGHYDVIVMIRQFMPKAGSGFHVKWLKENLNHSYQSAAVDKVYIFVCIGCTRGLHCFINFNISSNTIDIIWRIKYHNCQLAQVVREVGFIFMFVLHSVYPGSSTGRAWETRKP